MTEAEWLASGDSEPMLTFVSRTTSDRKLRLYFCESARNVLHLLGDPRYQRSVDTAELYADGGATPDELAAVHKACCIAAHSATGLPSMNEVQVRAAAAAWNVALCAQAKLDDEWTTSRKFWEANDARLRRCSWLRDIFGNPFRRATIHAEWLTSTVVTLAQHMYESRDFSAMAILADALQDAGCDNTDILSHCRGPGPHVRGCWVVDLILGKE